MVRFIQVVKCPIIWFFTQFLFGIVHKYGVHVLLHLHSRFPAGLLTGHAADLWNVHKFYRCRFCAEYL